MTANNPARKIKTVEKICLSASSLEELENYPRMKGSDCEDMLARSIQIAQNEAKIAQNKAMIRIQESVSLDVIVVFPSGCYELCKARYSFA